MRRRYVFSPLIAVVALVFVYAVRDTGRPADTAS